MQRAGPAAPPRCLGEARQLQLETPARAAVPRKVADAGKCTGGTCAAHVGSSLSGSRSRSWSVSAGVMRQGSREAGKPTPANECPSIADPAMMRAAPPLLHRARRRLRPVAAHDVRLAGLFDGVRRHLGRRGQRGENEDGGGENLTERESGHGGTLRPATLSAVASRAVRTK